MTDDSEELRAALLMITHKANEANIHRDEDDVLETIIEIARAALAAAPQPASSCPPPRHGGDTYYTKGKTADWWVGLTDEQFAWELTCAAQDLNDTGLGDDLDKWMPHQVMLADAAKRIKRLSAAPQPAVADREACRGEQAEPARGADETPYDRGYVWGYRHGLRDGKAEVAPQPAPWYEDQHRFAVVSSDYSRPFLLGAYPTLPNAVKAQCGSPEKWHIFERHSTAPQPDPEDDWRNDPSADERWNAGCDYAMTALCKLLRINTDDVTWDAATEELEGDVLAVIGNILTVRFGDDWRKAAPQPAVADREAYRAKQAEPDRGFDETPYDRGYVWGYRHGLRDGKAEVAPQPALADREALVEVLRPYVGAGMAHAIADALLARGLRLPGDAEAERDALQGQLNDLRNGWAKSVKAHAALLAERDAAFAAGQRDMQERAIQDVAEWGRLFLGSGENVTVDVIDDLRDLPIKPRP